eukprot:6636309-Pyramimonas_sp.AAC.1
MCLADAEAAIAANPMWSKVRPLCYCSTVPRYHGTTVPLCRCTARPCNTPIRSRIRSPVCDHTVHAVGVRRNILGLVGRSIAFHHHQHNVEVDWSACDTETSRADDAAREVSSSLTG